MSRINSMFKQAQSVAQQTVNTAKKEVAKQEDKVRTVTTRGMSDGFDGGLYDAGAKKSGRATIEKTFTRGLDVQLGDASNSQHVVAGFQAHGFAQRAGSVVSAGGDVFLGAKEHTVSTEAGVRRESTVKLGAEAAAAGFAGTVNGFKAGAQVGLELKEKSTERSDLGNGLQLKSEETVKGFWGAVAKGGAQVGTVIGAEAEVFVGVRGMGEKRLAVTAGNTEKGAVAGRFGAGAGFGALAHAEAGYDADEKQVRASGDVGAYFFAGAQVGGDVTLGGKDE